MVETVAEPGCRRQDERRGVHRAVRGSLDRPVDAATGLDAWERNRPSPPRALIRSRKPSSYAKASEDKYTGSVS